MVVDKVFNELKEDLEKTVKELDIDEVKLKDKTEKIMFLNSILAALLTKELGMSRFGMELFGLTFYVMQKFLIELINTYKEGKKDVSKGEVISEIFNDFLSAEMVVTTKIIVTSIATGKDNAQHLLDTFYTII